MHNFILFFTFLFIFFIYLFYFIYLFIYLFFCAKLFISDSPMLFYSFIYVIHYLFLSSYLLNWIPGFTEGSYGISSVRLSVRLSVCDAFFSGTTWSNFLIFCRKLEGHNWKRVPKPQNLGNWGKFGLKWHFSIYFKI